ncbi:hypothetical protein MTBLM5_130061 [Magnetospirillum sp. LM-5]|uniref:hypothetical protein n=1 Tax=Magnetospirillum sp. LM-5 TaxID=2681466 RepID=UPI00137EBFE3|nr:hypothetical protein [Magnetospirillum sp. LM-5]CAA7614392.1 hypothetical protein MTBLM5_130061 [Magnetospirillum sp. LM-5]
MTHSGKPDYNRNVKLACRCCGYIARTSRKWLDQAGPPHCPDHGPMEVVGAVNGVLVRRVLPSPSPSSVGEALRFLHLVGAWTEPCDGRISACDTSLREV